MNKEESTKKIAHKAGKKTFQGVVVSDAMDKTIVVNVSTKKQHPMYGKRYISSKKYKVHDAENIYHVGDEVTFVETRPLSKDKRWRVIGKLKKSSKENKKSA